jgi:hypothetical protein
VQAWHRAFRGNLKNNPLTLYLVFARMIATR